MKGPRGEDRSAGARALPRCSRRLPPLRNPESPSSPSVFPRNGCARCPACPRESSRSMVARRSRRALHPRCIAETSVVSCRAVYYVHSCPNSSGGFSAPDSSFLHWPRKTGRGRPNSRKCRMTISDRWLTIFSSGFCFAIRPGRYCFRGPPSFFDRLFKLVATCTVGSALP